MDDRDKINDSTDAQIERAKDSALGSHDSNPSHIDEAGEAVGGITGVVAGAAIGSLAGPVGTVIGGIAGAMGGWWSGRAVTEAASTLTSTDDDYYRAHYESSPNRLADRSYDDVRPAYHLGHVAAHNPEYARKDWGGVSNDLERGWSDDNVKKHGAWSVINDYAGAGFLRGRSSLGFAANKVENTSEKFGNKVADVADDMKDRVDGNPASKPGPDATDSARRL
ncbi:MAG: hypothetical protein ABI625_11785, partial [bacterium]